MPSSLLSSWWKAVFIDPLHFVLAAGPLALYLLLLGGINLSTRPLVTTGGRDLMSLAIALAGCAVAGPMELFFPESFAGTPWLTWLMLLSLYGMIAVLIVLLARPRLVIYNLTPSQLRPTLAKVVMKLDPEARWAGDSAYLPNIGVQFLIEPFVLLKNVQLVASAPASSIDGWKALERELVVALRGERTAPNPFGFVLTTFGTLLTAVSVFCLMNYRYEVTRSLETMLFLDRPGLTKPEKPKPVKKKTPEKPVEPKEEKTPDEGTPPEPEKSSSPPNEVNEATES